MSNEKDVGIVLRLVDKVTNPLDKISQRLNKMQEPAKRIKKSFSGFLNVTGFDKLKQRISQTGQSLGKLANEGKALAFKFTAATAGMAFALNKLLISPAANTEQIAQRLSVFEGSAAQTEATLNRLKGLSQEYNRDFTSMAEGYMQMANQGIKATDKMLLGISAASIGTGKSAQDVSNAIASTLQGSYGALEDYGIKAEQVGKNIVFTWQENGKQVKQAVAANNKALTAELASSILSRRYENQVSSYSNTWQGMLGRIQGYWSKFTDMIANSGFFQAVKDKLNGILEKLDQWDKDGTLERWANVVSDKLVAALDWAWEAGQNLWGWMEKAGAWFSDAIEWVGGFENALAILAVLMGGKLLFSIASLAKGVLGLGAALLTTPLGWFMMGIAAIAGGVYLIIKNWDKIKAWLSGLWKHIKSRFSEGIVGIAKLILEFNPITLFAKGLNALSEWLFGFSLFDAGMNIINSLWDGLKSIWAGISNWFREKVNSLTSWMPTKLRVWLGLEDEKPDTPDQPGGGGGQPGGQPSYPTGGYPSMDGMYYMPSGPPTGASQAMTQAAQNRGQAQDVDVTTKVVIEGKNLPQGMEVSAPRSQADRTELNLGYQAVFP